MTYDNTKSYKKTEFHPFFRRYIFEKTTRGQIDRPPSSLFWVKFVPNRLFIFFTKKNKFLKFVPKRPSSFLTRNEKFWKLYPNGHSFFYNKIQDIENCTQRAIRFFLQQNANFWKLESNSHSSLTTTTQN